MALSDIQIKDAVVHFTQLCIAGSNFDQLRQFLLERKPIQTVLDNVNYNLQQACDSDKQQFRQDKTQQAIQKQILSDEQDEFNDKDQNVKEMGLFQEYTAQLPGMRGQLEIFNSSYRLQEAKTQLAQSQYDSIKREELRVQSNLSSIRIQKNLLLAQYPYHTSTVHTHHHSHPLVVVNSNSNWTWVNQVQWTRLCIEESQLTGDLQQIQNNINLRNAELGVEQRNSRQLFDQKTKLEATITSMQRQLDFEFPQNERTRQRHQEERTFRANARLADDPELNQLSYRNREELKQEINISNRALDRLKEKLSQEATEMSYSCFLTEVEQALASQNLQYILFMEKEALKKIVIHMKEYQVLEGQEHNKKHQLAGERQKLQTLQRNDEKNASISQKNDALNQKSDSAAEARNASLFVGGVSAAGGIAGAIMIANMIVDPLLFFVPGGLAVVAVVSLVVALVYQYKKSSYDSDVQYNIKSMQENETALLDDSYKKGNNNSPKPNLKQQIQTTEETIESQDKLLQEHQREMRLVLQKANNIQFVQQGMYPFLSSPGSTLTKDPHAPSAPDLDELPPPYMQPTYNVDDLLKYGNYPAPTYN